MTLRLAVVSDLHCHVGSDFEDGHAESMLVGNALRLPAERHPVEALVRLIRATPIEVDALLCPGDLAHKASPEGLALGWSIIRELGAELHARETCCTLGNHDVASRAGGADPFRIAKRLHSDFPFRSDQMRQQYWAHGFAIQGLSATADVVVVNTAYHHYGEDAARHGTFEANQISELDAALTTRPSPGLRVALLHHHPVLHTVAGLETRDALPNGDDLLRVLRAHGCDLVVHGHKHHPRLRRETIDGQPLIVFAAGSMGAYLSELATRTRNLFHTITIDSGPTGCHGIVSSWEFNYGKGWNPASPQSAEFPFEAHFGPAPSGGLAARLLQRLDTDASTFVSANDLVDMFPEVDWLVPDEMNRLGVEIAAAGTYKVRTDGVGRLEGIGRIHPVSPSRVTP